LRIGSDEGDTLLFMFNFIWKYFFIAVSFINKRVAIMKAKFQIRQRCYHQCSNPTNFKSANATTTNVQARQISNPPTPLPT